MLRVILCFLAVFFSEQIFSAPSPIFSSLHEIYTKLPEYDVVTLQNLMVNRVGSEQGYMKTKGLHCVIQEGQLYQLSPDGLRVYDSAIEGKEIHNLSYSMSQQEMVENIPPNRAILVGDWIEASDENYFESERASNILGVNGRLCISTEKRVFHIPIEIASPEKLSYYGAVAVEMGAIVKFPSEETGYPIWGMNIGPTYSQDYIMTDKGGGWYLEWHLDRPHFHMPLSEDASGVYLLAKKIEAGKYEVTAFHIPYGIGVFTRRGVIHCDAGLVGENWVVGYSTAREFSTVLLRNQQDERIQLVFK